MLARVITGTQALREHRGRSGYPAPSPPLPRVLGLSPRPSLGFRDAEDRHRWHVRKMRTSIPAPS